MSTDQVLRFAFPSDTQLRMRIIATFMGYGKHMRTNFIATAEETDLEAWNKVLKHDMVFYVPSSTSSCVAGAILVHQPGGVDACRWEIEVLALAPEAEDHLAQVLLNRVQKEARESGRKTLVSIVCFHDGMFLRKCC